MMKRLLAFLLAGALVAPQTCMANKSVFHNDERLAVPKFSETLPLPPVRYLDTMPWINFDTQSKWRGIDTLLPLDWGVTGKNNSAFANSEPEPQYGRPKAE